MTQSHRRKTIERRTLLKGAVAAAAVAPAMLRSRDALSSSGSVDVYAWDKYVSQDMIAAFESKTGIKLNLTTFGTNNEVLYKLPSAANMEKAYAQTTPRPTVSSRSQPSANGRPGSKARKRISPPPSPARCWAAASWR